MCNVRPSDAPDPSDAPTVRLKAASEVLKNLGLDNPESYKVEKPKTQLEIDSDKAFEHSQSELYAKIMELNPENYNH